MRDAPAILVGWFLGSAAGLALADVLTGRAAPSGRLPVSFPRESGQQPFYYNHKSTGRPQAPGEAAFFKARYVEVANEALYPFGFGLGYASIAYGEPTLSSATLQWDGWIESSVEVRNAGTRSVDEVVQLYIRDVAASVTRPVRELKGFRKVTLAPGQTLRVRFTITRDELAFVGSDLRWRAEPGAFDVWIASSSAAGRPVRFTLRTA